MKKIQWKKMLIMAVLLLTGAFAFSAQATAAETVPQSMALSKSTIGISINQIYKVTATVLPADATNKSVAWKSSNAKVASVDAYGNIKGWTSGSATITATAKGNTKVVKTVDVKVSPKIVKLNKTSLSLVVGKSAALTASVSPTDSKDKEVTWKSSNTKIATVDSKGKVTGKAKGTATVTATVKGTKAATAKITVTPPVLATAVKLSKTSATLGKGKTLSLTATVYPSTTTNKAVSWKSSNTKIATVTSSGQVKAVGPGTAKITATTNNGKYSTAAITVPYVKSLGAGTWKGGTSIPAGRYRITTTAGFGNLFINSKDPMENRYINEILSDEDDDWSVQKVTTDIKAGDTIEIMGLDSVQFTKVVNVKSNTLHAGYWTVGKDIYAGRYKITTPSGSGNLFIDRGDDLLVNEILSAKKEDYAVTSVTQTLKNGDIIQISSLEKVVFTKY